LWAAKRRLLPSPRVSRLRCRGRKSRVTREIGRTVNMRHSAAPALYALSRSSSPMAAVRYSVAHLSSCATTSLIDHGRRLTDEAFRTRVGKLSAGSPGWLFHVFAPVALRSFAAGL